MLFSGTTMAWSYVLTGFSYDLPLALLGGLFLWLGLVRLVFKGSWPACMAAGALVFHAASLWLVLVAYEDLPPGLEPNAIAEQAGVAHYVLDGGWDTARELVIDSQEEFAYCGFMSSNRGTNKDRKPGIARVELRSGLVTGRYHSRMGDTFVLDEQAGRIWFSDFLDGHVRALNLDSMETSGSQFKISPWPDGVARIGEKSLVVRVETPRRDDPELYWIHPDENRAFGVEVPAHKWGHLNAAMEAVADRHEVFLLQTGDDHTTLSAVSEEGVRVSTRLPGIIWEAAWDAKVSTLWLGSMTENKVFKVEPTALRYEAIELPNGIREILPLPDGRLALADYLRARVYIFDGESIVRTIRVGRKPEALALGPVTKNLYVLSDAGLTRIKL